jgi:C4-dicarboxylate-specific signal transduction histidine kinase
MSEPTSVPQTPPSRQLSPNPFIVTAFLLVIGLIGFGGYRASEYQGMQTLRTDAGHRLDLFAAAVDGIVNRYAHIPATIQLNEEVLNVMHKPRSPAHVLAANRFLQRLNGHIGSIAIFVVDERGIVLASSNWDHPDDSFIGEDLSFRSYYLDGLAGRVGRHFAIGITRGQATSCRIRSATANTSSAWRSSRSVSASSTRPGTCSVHQP